MIADWLYVNGVDYRYEADYEHPTADREHRQYQPDFCYPGIGVYHEHFALDRNGNPPPHFAGYADGVRWKRQLHRTHGTTLIETTSSSIRDESGFAHLAKELTRRGIVLDPKPRPAADPRVLAGDREVYGLLRSFLSHAKNSRLDEYQLHTRAGASAASPVRARLFLEVFCPLRAAWDRRLADAGTIDFDDMIIQAVDLIRAGRWTSPYELVLVDEFQDTSAARADLIAALVDQPHRYLLTVGDDWQSINRFAGADVSVMTRFHERFGEGHTLRLQETFRSPQSLCDLAGRFVARNPAQIDKTIISRQPDRPPTVRVVAVPGRDITEVLRRHLDALDISHTDTAVTPAPGRTRSGRPAANRGSVLVLSRYKTTRDETRLAIGDARWPHLDISHDTVHASKGREADHVIIIGLEHGGFPCEIEDDPLLGIALPDADPYPFADERRLFCVALTRARRDVLLLTRQYRESVFVEELIADGLQLLDPTGRPVPIVRCPTCSARMRLKDGRYGPFWSCSRYRNDRTGCNTTRPATDDTATKHGANKHLIGSVGVI